MTPRRNSLITLHPSKKGFNIVEKNEVIKNAYDDYFIYMKNANLRNDGVIEGRYLGTTQGNLIDDYCVELNYDRNIGYNIEGVRIRTAKMLAVKNYENEKRVIIIIE